MAPSPASACSSTRRAADRRGCCRLDRAGRADRAHLRHAPGVDFFDAVVVLPGQRIRRGRTGRALSIATSFKVVGRLFSCRECAAASARLVGTAANIVTALAFQQLIDRWLPSGAGAGHHHFRAAHRAGESERPRIGVEHRHDRQHRVRRFSTSSPSPPVLAIECSTFERCE